MVNKKVLSDIRKVVLLLLVAGIAYTYHNLSFRKDKETSLKELVARSFVERERIAKEVWGITRKYLSQDEQEIARGDFLKKEYDSLMIRLDFELHNASAPKEVIKIVIDSKEALSWMLRVQGLVREAKNQKDLKRAQDLFEIKVIKRIEVIRRDIAVLKERTAIFYIKIKKSAVGWFRHSTAVV